MRYRIINGVATADIAYEVYGETLKEIFENAAWAVTQTMVEPATIHSIQNFKFQIADSQIDDLLFDFLNELIFLKDARQMLFSRFGIKLTKLDARRYQLDANFWGEKIDIKKHKLKCDVKAVTRHKFFLKKAKGKYITQIVLDI